MNKNEFTRREDVDRINSFARMGNASREDTDGRSENKPRVSSASPSVYVRTRRPSSWDDSEDESPPTRLNLQECRIRSADSTKSKESMASEVKEIKEIFQNLDGGKFAEKDSFPMNSDQFRDGSESKMATDRRQSPARIRRRSRSSSGSSPVLEGKFHGGLDDEEAEGKTTGGDETFHGFSGNSSPEKELDLNSKIFLENYFSEIRKKMGFGRADEEGESDVETLAKGFKMNESQVEFLENLYDANDAFYCRTSRKLSKILEVEEMKKDHEGGSHLEKMNRGQRKKENASERRLFLRQSPKVDKDDEKDDDDDGGDDGSSPLPTARGKYPTPKSAGWKRPSRFNENLNGSISDRCPDLMKSGNNDDIIFLTPKSAKTEIGLNRESDWMEVETYSRFLRDYPMTSSWIENFLRGDKKCRDVRDSSLRIDLKQNFSEQSSSRKSGETDNSCRFEEDRVGRIEWQKSPKFKLNIDKDSSRSLKVEDVRDSNFEGENEKAEVENSLSNSSSERWTPKNSTGSTSKKIQENPRMGSTSEKSPRFKSDGSVAETDSEISVRSEDASEKQESLNNFFSGDPDQKSKNPKDPSFGWNSDCSSSRAYRNAVYAGNSERSSAKDVETAAMEAVDEDRSSVRSERSLPFRKTTAKSSRSDADDEESMTLGVLGRPEVNKNRKLCFPVSQKSPKIPTIFATATTTPEMSSRSGRSQTNEEDDSFKPKDRSRADWRESFEPVESSSRSLKIRSKDDSDRSGKSHGSSSDKAGEEAAVEKLAISGNSSNSENGSADQTNHQKIKSSFRDIENRSSPSASSTRRSRPKSSRRNREMVETAPPEPKKRELKPFSKSSARSERSSGREKSIVGKKMVSQKSEATKETSADKSKIPSVEREDAEKNHDTKEDRSKRGMEKKAEWVERSNPSSRGTSHRSFTGETEEGNSKRETSSEGHGSRPSTRRGAAPKKLSIISETSLENVDNEKKSDASGFLTTQETNSEPVSDLPKGVTEGRRGRTSRRDRRKENEENKNDRILEDRERKPETVNRKPSFEEELWNDLIETFNESDESGKSLSAQVNKFPGFPKKSTAECGMRLSINRAAFESKDGGREEKVDEDSFDLSRKMAERETRSVKKKKDGRSLTKELDSNPERLTAEGNPARHPKKIFYLDVNAGRNNLWIGEFGDVVSCCSDDKFDLLPTQEKPMDHGDGGNQDRSTGWNAFSMMTDARQKGRRTKKDETKIQRQLWTEVGRTGENEKGKSEGNPEPKLEPNLESSLVPKLEPKLENFFLPCRDIKRSKSEEKILNDSDVKKSMTVDGDGRRRRTTTTTTWETTRGIESSNRKRKKGGNSIRGGKSSGNSTSSESLKSSTTVTEELFKEFQDLSKLRNSPTVVEPETEVGNYLETETESGNSGSEETLERGKMKGEKDLARKRQDGGKKPVSGGSWLIVRKNSRNRNDKSKSIYRRKGETNISKELYRATGKNLLKHRSSGNSSASTVTTMLKLRNSNCFQNFYKRLISIFCVTSVSAAATSK